MIKPLLPAKTQSRTTSGRRREGGVVFATALCIVGGCSVERMIAVDRIESRTEDAGSTGSEASIEGASDARSQGADGASSADGAQGGSDSAAGSSCESPAFVTSSTGGIWSNDGYFVFNNVWNTSADPGPQTLYACSYHSWYVVSDQNNDAGVVESYPNVQMNFNDVPLSSLQAVTSTFAEKSPHVGVYEDAYDVWMNGVAVAGSTQIMIWVDNYNRVPDGSRVTTTTLSNRTYDVWKTSDNTHIVLVSTATFTSGTVDLLEVFNWTIAQGWLRPSSTLGQIDFGVEIESTGGASATYQFDDFSITSM
jgi:hypothetical protein